MGADYLEKQQSELSNELSLTKKSLSIMMVSHCCFWCCTLVPLDRPIGSLECSIYIVRLINHLFYFCVYTEGVEGVQTTDGSNWM